jgi:hypothetical protein
MRIPAIIVALLFLVICGCAAPVKSTVIQPVPMPQPAGPVINYFYASPAAVTCPAAATLTWKVTDADNITIDQGIGPDCGIRQHDRVDFGSNYLHAYSEERQP